MKALSILGCGWIGTPLAKAFLAEGFIVKGSATSSEKKEILSGYGIEAYVINLAEEFNQPEFFTSKVLIVTVPPRSRSQEPGVYKQQVTKLVNFIALKDNIKHVIYTSSTSVYKDENRQWKEEDLDSSAVAENKELFEVEQLFLSLTDRQVTILRLGGLTGGNRMLARHFAGKKDIVGGGKPVNLVHYEDVVGVIMFVVKKNLKGIYNVCSSSHPPKKDFYTALCLQFKLEAPNFIDEPLSGKIIDSRKIQDKGYVFKYPNSVLFTYEF